MRSFEGYSHGINFGGWFSQCDHSEKRYDYYIRRDDFRRVAGWGLDHVRIPIDYELVLDEKLNYKENGFKRVKDCIDWSKENGLNMILDLHKTIGFSFDKGENEEGFFVNERYQDIFIDLWKEFALRFGKNENLSFELLNEVSDPQYCDSWNRIIKKTIKAIRQYAPDIHILVGGYNNNSIEAIKDLEEPYDDKIVYNFHCYSPLIYTHQGAYWIDLMDRSFRMPFDSRYRDYQNNTERYIGKNFHEQFPLSDDVIDASYFEKMFKEAIEVCEKRDVPLYCGEYGVIDLVDPDDTMKWFECINSVFEKYHIGRALWSYKEMDFGLVDAHYDPIRGKLIKLL